MTQPIDTPIDAPRRYAPVMHVDQLAPDVDTVRRLVADQFPDWAGWTITAVDSQGTVNALFRIGDRLAARLPLQLADVEETRRWLEIEAAAARELLGRTPFATPEPVAIGAPGCGFPLPWSVQTWLTGTTATEADPAGSPAFAGDLAAFIRGVRSIDTRGRVFARTGRGGHLGSHDSWMETCFQQSEDLLDVPRLRRIWAALRELPRTAADVMTHGDLIPGNVLVQNGRLTGVIDVGGLGPADPALDLVAGWHLLDDEPRQILRNELHCDDLQWARGQAWAFEQAMGVVWYYAESNPAMSRMGRRTLARIVEDPSARAEPGSRHTLSDKIREGDPVPGPEEHDDEFVPGSAPAHAKPQTLYARTLAPGQRCEVWIAGPGGGENLVLATDEMLLEAPNWTTDGSALILNGSGVLWRFDLQLGTLDQVPLSGVPELNNDHVLAPDGRSIYLSANDGHIYHADLAGGPGVRVTADDAMLHYLHGVRPDGRQLAYVGIPAGDPSVPGRLFVAPADGPGPAREIATGKGHVDGPEYSPDGQWIYLNTEAFTTTIGHAQIGRLRGDGDGLEQLVRSDTVDWFPHLSPDGELAAYLRFPAGTQGHPADRAVEIVLVATSDWTTPMRIYGLPGGQGTINVNSWAPDSRRFAFVSYPAG